MFWDTARVEVTAGKGGDGLVSFLHEKFRARGGPDGGDGGRGGSIDFVAQPGETTLSYFRAHRQIRAEAGERGKKQRQHGRSGADVTVEVPVGTIIREQGREAVVDLAEPGARFRAAQGGRGGFGNAHFTSSTRQAPDVSEVGQPGEDRILELELKLVADVGLVGLPNAGKSTLLRAITAAKPKVADYPFTTTVPGLGVVERAGYHFVVCDIPGLIEGASQGKGLGHEFLRHVERSRLLVHLLDGTSDSLERDYQTIRSELERHNPALASRPELLVVNKSDLIGDQTVVIGSRKPDFIISAATGEGTGPLLGAIAERLQKLPKPTVVPVPEPSVRRVTAADDPSLFLVEKEEGAFRVTGGKVEEFARRMDLRSAPSARRMRDILKRLGVTRELTRLGAKDGDEIRVGEQRLEFRLPRLGGKRK